MENLLEGSLMWQCTSLTSNLQPQAIKLLKLAKEIPLFLLSNLMRFGSTLSEQPSSGNVYCILHQDRICALFMLTRRGVLLTYAAQNHPEILSLIARTCLQEPVKMHGLIGEWQFCTDLWNVCEAMHVVKPAVTFRKEMVYTALSAESHHATQQEWVRCLEQQDYPAWRALRLSYIKESQLPSDLSEVQLHEDFDSMVRQKTVWGYFLDGQLVSIANLNAYACDIAQLGGVYTAPSFRGRGYAKAVIRHILSDLPALHRISTLIIFTEEDNWNARRLYESFGIVPENDFAVIFSG